MKSIILILIIFVLSVAGYPVYKEYKQFFGMKASNISGYGMLYGYKITPDTKLQLTGIYYLLDSDNGNVQYQINNYTLGLEFQKDIIQQNKQHVYLMAGAYYYHDDDQTINDNPKHIIKDSYNLGYGVGYEYFFQRVALGVEIGYKLFKDYSKEKEGEQGWIEVYEKESKIGAGLSIGFIF